MYPLCWTKASKEGFYMKYDFGFKLKDGLFVSAFLFKGKI